MKRINLMAGWCTALLLVSGAALAQDAGNNGQDTLRVLTPEQAAAEDATADSTRDERVSNTPAVEQPTTSGSGSPAVLSDNEGRKRDGTNNVQRATMNMVGSPAGNLELGNKADEPDSEMKDRQAYTQKKQRSKELSDGDNAKSTDNDRSATTADAAPAEEATATKGAEKDEKRKRNKRNRRNR